MTKFLKKMCFNCKFLGGKIRKNSIMEIMIGNRQWFVIFEIDSNPKKKDLD